MSREANGSLCKLPGGPLDHRHPTDGRRQSSRVAVGFLALGRMLACEIALGAFALMPGLLRTWPFIASRLGRTKLTLGAILNSPLRGL